MHASACVIVYSNYCELGMREGYRERLRVDYRTRTISKA
jgi:hypothetical protein